MIARGPQDRDLEAPLERGARVKRRPHWLNNTVDPALAAANRIPLPNECECPVNSISYDVLAWQPCTATAESPGAAQ